MRFLFIGVTYAEGTPKTALSIYGLRSRQRPRIVFVLLLGARNANGG